MLHIAALPAHAEYKETCEGCCDVVSKERMLVFQSTEWLCMPCLLERVYQGQDADLEPSDRRLKRDA